MEEEQIKPKKSEKPEVRLKWSEGSMDLEADTDTETESHSTMHTNNSEMPASGVDLLRLRRSSLQRQSRVQEDEDQDDLPIIPQRFLPLSEHADEKLVSTSSRDGEHLRTALAAEIQTLSKKIQTVPPQELAAILQPVSNASFHWYALFT